MLAIQICCLGLSEEWGLRVVTNKASELQSYRSSGFEVRDAYYWFTFRIWAFIIVVVTSIWTFLLFSAYVVCFVVAIDEPQKLLPIHWVPLARHLLPIWPSCGLSTINFLVACLLPFLLRVGVFILAAFFAWGLVARNDANIELWDLPWSLP